MCLSQENMGIKFPRMRVFCRTDKMNFLTFKKNLPLRMY